MKKTFYIIALIQLFLVGSLHAQEAFKHLGASLEVGSTGLGINVSYPLVTDRLIVTVGYNFPSLSIKKNFEMNSEPINRIINQSNAKIDSYNSLIEHFPDKAKEMGMTPIHRIENIDKTMNAEIQAKLNFGNFKVMAEYYPTKKSYFHITAGFLIGNGTWMDVNATVDQRIWASYIQAIEENANIPYIKRGDFDGEAPIIDIKPEEGLENTAKVNILNETYVIRPNSGGHLNTKFTINKFKPYLGVGFGNSIPSLGKKRLGFQMEIGAYYQGKPSFVSDSKTEYDPDAFSSKEVDDIADMLQYLRWYPQLTFRFTGKIF